jgi:hypothetical protein
MVEGGKRFIMRTVVRSIEQYFRLGFGDAAKLRLIAWGDAAEVVAWPKGDDMPPRLLECDGAAAVESLTALIGHPQDEAIVIITDGYWSKKMRDALKQWRDTLPPKALSIIKTGSDANPLLKGDGIYTSENIFEALDSFKAGDSVA